MIPAGAIDLVCERRGGRTVVARAHNAGLARTSRLPSARDGAAHVMLATLGPGVLRGDRFVTTGRLGPDAALLVTAQMATPIFPGAAARLETRWDVATGATLCAIGAPIVPLPGCSVELVLALDVAGSGLAIAAETLVVARDAMLRGRTLGALDGSVVLRDVVELRASATRAPAIGSVYAIAADDALRTRLTAEAWEFVDAAGDVRGGVGGVAGAVVVRFAGGAFAVEQATAVVAERWRAIRLRLRVGDDEERVRAQAALVVGSERTDAQGTEAQPVLDAFGIRERVLEDVHVDDRITAVRKERCELGVDERMRRRERSTGGEVGEAAQARRVGD